ncbi:MAG: cation efflux protein [Chitinophagaceae bacterium]|nr:cation efflux protein [Chitinophagaceae bacterium]
MLDHIIRFSIRNKLIIGLFTLALVLVGVYSATQLPIDAVPDITNNQVQIITQSPSLAAQEVERLITFPVEMAVANIPETKEVRSISRFGLSVVTVVFKDEADIYWARQQVAEHLVEVTQSIPPSIGIPSMGPVTSGLGEIYQYTLAVKPEFAKKYSIMELRSIQDWVIRRQLLGTEGVADVSSFGGMVKQYEIALNTDKLRSYNLSIQDVFTALELNNQNTGGAYIDKKPNAYFIRSEGLINSLSDIEKIEVSVTANGMAVLIRDIASVGYGNANRYGAMTRDGKGEVVGAVVMMLKGENSSKVIQNVKARIAQIEKTLPEGITVEPFLDRTHLVNRAITTVSKNLIEGALIVIFVLVLFLGNFRGGLIVASMIPLCLLFALSLMNLFGVSGNLMSLGAIDFGLIVDGAVIIVEATMHHLGLSKLKRLTQDEMDEEVYQAASKIRSSAAFGEIIILVVYLPILVLTGVEGKMFRPMAETVGFAILGAFILSLTYVPMASALFLNKNVEHKRNFSDKMMDFFHRVYAPIIHHTLNHKIKIVAIAVVLLLISVFAFLQMGGEFIPSLEEGDFAVETRILTGSSLSQTIDASTKAEKILLDKFPEVKQVVCKIGSSEIPTDPMPIEAGDLMIILKDKDEWTSADTREELVEKMAKALSDIPGVSFGFQQPIQMRFNELMTGARQDVAVKIFGEDLTQLTYLSKKIAAIIPEVKGTQDLYLEEVIGLPQVVVKIDRDKLYQFNVSVEDVNRTILAAFAGESAGLVYEGEKRFDLVVRLEKDSRQDIDNIRNVFVANSEGKQIPLHQLAEVKLTPGPNQIQREDTKRRLTIGFNVRGRDVESIVNEMKQRIDSEIDFPPGYYVTYGGQFENLLEAKGRLAFAVPVALFLIFMLLFFTFGSVKQSFLIFSAIPFSAIGGIWALYLRGMPFSISAGIGFIALFGVSVLNGIVLIGEFNRLKKEGLTDIKEIILQATSIRLRPVLMTATVASLGFLPMALSQGSGAEVQKPLATVVIGGLLSATLLTLIVLPILYTWFENGIKMKQPSNLSMLLFAVLSLSFVSSAQAQTTPLTMDYCIQQALSNNNSVKSAEYAIAQNKELRKTSFDLSKTNVTGMYGQYNSYRNDLNVTVSQNISFPTVYMNLSDLAKANLASSEIRKDIVQNELIYNVKQTWYQLLLLAHQKKFLEDQDSIYERYSKAAATRYRTGDINILEKITIETQLAEIKNKLFQNQADLGIALNRMATLLNSKEKLTFTDSLLTKRPLNLSTEDSASFASNPALAFMKQKIAVTESQKNLERSKLMPDFNLGYFNQSLRGYQDNDDQVTQYYNSSNRFQGVMVGVSIPLWARAQAARVKAADYTIKAAEADYELLQRNLYGQYNQLLQEYMKYNNSLMYYEKNVLPQADIILSNAYKTYVAGEINYVEYMTAINTALNMRSDYLNLLDQYNQSVINIEFIIGNN